jgi:ornithine cyclodeaminase/alanine dehydrogenase-like protein (mu-crystallin family)
MPAYVGGDKEEMGLKWGAGYPENRKKDLPVTWGIMVMNDVETGAVTAIMDARWITAIRTAAVAAVTAKYCKVRNSYAMTIVGAGEQGRWNARLMKLVIPELRRIYINDIYEAAIDAFLNKMRPLMPDMEFVPVRTHEELCRAIDESQILLTATQRGEKPIIYSEMLHKGMLGIPLESTAWEGTTYTRFADRFVCDDWNLVQEYLKNGKYTDGLPDEYQILGKIINGDAVGRANEEEFVITPSHGIALSDVAVGQMILEKAEARGVGTMLPLLEEAEIIR